MEILVIFAGHLLGGFLGRLVSEWLFRGLSDDERKHWYKEGFWEGYRLAMREKDNDENN